VLDSRVPGTSSSSRLTNPRGQPERPSAPHEPRFAGATRSNHRDASEAIQIHDPTAPQDGAADREL
jgi:hypothetical protein